MTPHDEMIDDIAVYALGALPAGEAASVAAHLRTCEQCREEYRQLRSAVNAVAYSAEAHAHATGIATPGPLLKSRLMQQVRFQRARRPSSSVWPAYAAAAAIVIVALIGSFLFSARLGQDRARIAQQDVTITDLVSKASKHYPFSQGEVVTNGHRLYIAARLSTLPPGRVYQAWTLARGARTVAPSVTFVPDRSGVAVVSLPVDASATAAVALSVEPQGGSQQPTTKPIALVKLER